MGQKCKCCQKKSSSSESSSGSGIRSSASFSGSKSSISGSSSNASSSSGSFSTCCNNLNFFTITGADDPIGRWFTEQGYTFPFSVVNPYSADLLEFCGGVIGSINMSASCLNGKLCISFGTSGSAGYMLFSDCVTKGDNQCINNCGDCSPPFSPGGTGSISVDNPVCVNGVFVSQNFVIHTSNGNIYGTITA